MNENSMVTSNTSQGAPKQWWPAIAAAVISVIGLMGVAIYQNFYVQRNLELELINNQTISKRQELSRAEAVPKVQLILTTIQEADLPEQMLRSMGAIPSTIELLHIGGDPASGIDLLINSSESILEIHEWETLETYSVTLLGDERNRVKLTANRLRKNASIGFTVITASPTELEADLLIETGDEFVPPKPQDELLGFEAFFFPSTLGSDYLESDEFDQLPLQAQIEALEEQKDFLLEDTVSRWFMRSFGGTLSGIALVAMVIAGLLAVFSIFFLPDLRSDLAKRKEEAETLELIKAGDYPQEMSLTEVLVGLGKPDKLRSSGTVEEGTIDLFFFVEFLFIRNRPGLRFSFENQKLVQIFDKSGASLLA